jgi:endogenous inhibitor of DNA gyrase (YacG/DUF329 family)
MAAKKCPLCGKPNLVDMQGDFRFEPPPNIPGGAIVIVNSAWRHCETCGENIIPPELDKAIDIESKRRLKARARQPVRRV